MTDENDDRSELESLSWKFPFYHGAAVFALYEAARGTCDRETWKTTAFELFSISPAFFAAIHVASKHAEEFAACLSEEKRVSSERYVGGQPWEWPNAKPLDLLRRFSPEAAAVLERASEFASDWRAQEGCGVKRLDDLCDAVTAFEKAMEGRP